MQWKVHGQRSLYTSDWVNLDLFDVELPDGRQLEHHVIRMPKQSIATLVLDVEQRALLIWRHRFITDSWGWEIPAGWTDGSEAPIDAARREVEEETGWRPGPLKSLCTYNALPGISDARFHLFTADGATYQGPPVDSTEADRVEWVPISRVGALIERDELADGPTLTALTLVLALSGTSTD